MIKNGVITVKRITVDAVAMLLILIAPFLRYYSVPVLRVSFETLITFLLLGITGLLFFLRINEKVPRELKSAKTSFGLFLAWMIIITVAYELFTEINLNASKANYNAYSVVMPMIRGVIIYFLLSSRVKTDAAASLYSFFVALVIAIYIAQWLLLLAGVRISFKLPFAFEASWRDTLSKKIFGMNRYPTGLFSEKSHFCEYICPYIAICLYGNDIVKRNRIKKALLCSVCVAATASGNGVVLLAVMWLLYFVIFGQFKAKRYRILVAVAGIVALICVYFVLAFIPLFSDIFNRLFVDNTGSAFENAKADYRIYRGLDLFSKLPWDAKITGVGYSHMFLYAQKYNITSVFDRGWKLYEYFSAISMVLLYSGIIGLAFCASHFYGLYKHKSKIVKGLVVITVALWFSTEMLFRTTHVLYIVLMLAAMQKSAEQKEEQLCE